MGRHRAAPPVTPCTPHRRPSRSGQRLQLARRQQAPGHGDLRYHRGLHARRDRRFRECCGQCLPPRLLPRAFSRSRASPCPQPWAAAVREGSGRANGPPPHRRYSLPAGRWLPGFRWSAQDQLVLHVRSHRRCLRDRPAWATMAVRNTAGKSTDPASTDNRKCPGRGLGYPGGTCGGLSRNVVVTWCQRKIAPARERQDVSGGPYQPVPAGSLVG
jgi:hypothetical protein